MKAQFLIVLTCLLIARAQAQSVLFNFENAPQYTPLPITLTVGGVTAHFSATGQGFSIQLYNCQGLSPVGFSGLCIYPSSIYAADLIVDFSPSLTDFSILYAPEEYACDSSATMRVTAYLNGALVGTATTNAQAGTWPSETLRFSSPQTFNHVVVHYDAAPVTGGDYGPVFMADNMAVTPAPPPIVLGQATVRANGAFQFAFTNTPGSTCTVWSTTNVTLPLANWTALGAVTENPPGSGSFRFTDMQATNLPQCFYRVSSP
ncbi:MAG TPA: hypothetical protein VN784_04055 [Candidatus Limnocylindrales bacterium]|nr:hypothetical protein [Candidatus Limnocylindrales bacterium]